MSEPKYRILRAGEIIQDGDECDASNDPWHGVPAWQTVENTIGQPAPDPAYPAHTLYRRRIEEPTE